MDHIFAGQSISLRDFCTAGFAAAFGAAFFAAGLAAGFFALVAMSYLLLSIRGKVDYVF